VSFYCLVTCVLQFLTALLAKKEIYFEAFEVLGTLYAVPPSK
jgi:hypothetical protein